MPATYLDASAIVKLAVKEPESSALRRYLSRRRPLVSSALARTEVLRALLPSGEAAIRRGRETLSRLELVRVNDRILAAAGVIPPAEMRSHDAIHVVTAQQFGNDLGQLVTYDDRMASVANGLGLRVAAPS